jgi:hypothetical protein
MTTLTSAAEVQREAIARLGQAEYDRRIGIAGRKARAIAEDRSWFKDEADRENVFTFVAHRLRQIAIALRPERFAKFETMDHDSLGCALVKMMERGILI